MFYAEKDNKVLRIDEAEKDRYQTMGFDIIKEAGKKREVVAYGLGKTVSYDAYMKLKKENEDLMKQLKAMATEVKK